MKPMQKGALILALAALPLAAATAPAFAGNTIVHVKLWDKGSDSMDKLGDEAPMGFDMAGAAQKAKLATMGLTATPDAIPAGKITFEVTNSSKDTVHEMIIAPVKNMSTPLPYDKNDMRVEEEKAGHLGEVSELDPGKSGALTLTLKPGEYILYCNIPGHYVMGMWTLFKVKG